MRERDGSKKERERMKNDEIYFERIIEQLTRLMKGPEHRISSVRLLMFAALFRSLQWTR